MSQPSKLYNTLTRALEDFAPRQPPEVSLYACGPTVYDVPHVGHARSALIFDMLRRYLESVGYRVRYVRNVTDVDDKIIDRAHRELGAASEAQDADALRHKCRVVAEHYLEAYHAMTDRLGIAPLGMGSARLAAASPRCRRPIAR